MIGRPLSGRSLSGRRLAGNGLSTRGRGGGGASDFVPPPSIQLSGLTIAEDAAGLDEIGTASVANGSGTYTWAITADPDSKFAIDETTGVLSLAELATLDYETATSHQVTIEADNGVDDPISRQFTISVTNVLEVTLAALSLDAAELTENSAEDTAVGAVQDKSSGSTLSLIDDAGGRLKLSGTNIVAGATPSDYEVATSYNITLRETHPDASNSPRDTVIEVTILDDPDDTDTVPDAFEVGDWSIAPGDTEADVTISSLPADGGDTITDIEYRVDGGSPVSSGTDDTTGFTIPSLTNDQEYDVEIRAVNSVGAGAWSDTKQVTPEAEEEAWSPLDLGADLMMWQPLDDPAELWQASDGTTAVSADNDPIGRAVDQSANARHANQSTSGARPRFRTGTPNYGEFGPDDYLIAGNNYNSTAFGFAARVYRSGSQPDGAPIFDFWQISTTGRVMFVGNKISLQWVTSAGANVFNLDASFYVQDPNVLPNTTWVDVAVNVSGSLGAIYINGSLVRSQAVSVTLRNPNTASVPLNIGKKGDTATYFVGRLRNLVVINRPLTQGEIDNLVAMP